MNLRQIIRETIEKDLLNNINGNFHAWFDGSKVVDKNGNPLVVYHGTNSKFKKFNIKKSVQPIIWFTTDKNSIVSVIDL